MDIWTLTRSLFFCAHTFDNTLLDDSLGIGVASLTTPVYIAEMALPRMRGQLVTINALLVTFGQFTAGMVDGALDELLPDTGWRYMLGLAAVPGRFR